MRVQLIVTSAVVLLALAPARAQAPPETPAARLLREAGVALTADGLGALLDTLAPPAQDTDRVAALITGLGSPRYREREAASRALATLAWPPVAALEQAARSRDLETATRARHLLARVRHRPPPARLLAALAVVEQRKVAGLQPRLLALLARLPAGPHRGLARRAALASLRPTDAAHYSALLEAGGGTARALAVDALDRLDGAGWGDRLIALLTDASPPVRCAAAAALAARGDRRCLAPLGALLDDPDPAVRHRAVGTLRRLTGQRLGYPAGAEAALRAGPAAAWRAWIAGAGRTAALAHPLPTRPPELGRTLIAVWSTKTLIEVDVDQRKHLEVGGFDYLWGCQGLPDGHRLAVDSNRKQIVEYDAAGKPVRRLTVPGRPAHVQRLPSGNTLVAAHEALELDGAGRVVWRFRAPGGGEIPVAQRLANGITVVADRAGGQVLDVDRGGRVVARLRVMRAPYHLHRIPNGNTLVLSFATRSVVEYTPDGRQVWQKTGLQNPASVQRLSNGNTMISDANGVREFTPKGKVVWHYVTSRARFHRY